MGPWNLAGWVTPRQPRSRLEDTSTLPVSLTDLWRQHGGPGHSPYRKIWEVKLDLIMGRRPYFYLFIIITFIDFVV